MSIKARSGQLHPPFCSLVGGPTVLIETGGFRLPTDPTFDPPGEHKLPHVTLKETAGPALTVGEIGQVDAFLARAGRVLTTVAGAKPLESRAQGLAPWETTTLANSDGRTLRVTAAPARHGPAGIEPLRGDVIGFVLTF